ncbi:EFR1 family ferrodoxin [Methanobrevibacter sp.]|uniref:EFR1 family ferrodoxin n=1 Tax=Methanobrevibacter sp. TaxID=66852 RepID=UPI00388D5FEC
MKILYFTATGNNLYISKQLGGELLSIPQLVKDGIYDFEDDIVGIVFPVFYATSPKMLREFVEKVNIRADYIFLICSYGADGDQNALRIMKQTFENRGIKISYTNSVLMVDNFLPTFDMASEKKLKKDADIDGQIELIKEDILSRKGYIFEKPMFTDVPNIEVVLETTMTERFSIHVGEGCNGCQICSKVCPRGNITYEDDLPSIGDNCEFCLGCVHHCKTKTLFINDEMNPEERFKNPNIRVSEIIKSNNVIE